jgi:hypothetical protein
MSKQTKCFYGSSYDRGLIHLLKMWPDILDAVPEATLDICYGWNLFLKAFSNNPERMAWHDKMNELMKQPGITEHGRIGKSDLKKIRSACGIWTYPTDFDEINCITALECQNDGLVPCVVNKAALKETVESGIRIEGDIYMRETAEEYKMALIDLMKDEKKWKEESDKAIKFSKKYDWKEISHQWEVYF